MERTNKIYIVGTLKEIKDTRTGEKDGNSWIGGTAIVQSGSEENLIEVKYFTSETTVTGKPNKKYQNYLNLENLVGKRVKVNGELSGRAFYNAAQGQLIKFNEVTAGFFNSASENDEDKATFEYSGFVTQELTEKLNEKEELQYYTFSIGQANYNGETMREVQFRISPDRNDIADAVRDAYTVRTTVFIQGVIQHRVTTETREEEVAIGEPIVKTFTNVDKGFYMTGGKQPIVDDSAYTDEQIDKLLASYKEYIADIERKAKEQNNSGNSVSKNQPAKGDSNRLI
ncbi:MAG: hypothetical protein ACOCQD_01380 [archaeon]